MVFVAKRPNLYIPDLQQPTTDLVNVGLYFGTSISEEQASHWIALARAIKQTTRTLRCMWLRFADGDESVHSTLRLFGAELIGCAAVQSLILENKIGNTELMCLKDWLSTNTSLRGIKFLRTRLDTAGFTQLHDFFAGNSALKVLDVFGNDQVGDEAIREILQAILEGGSMLETVNVGENNFGEDVEGVARVTESGVEAILSYVRRTPSVAHLKIRLRAMTNTRLIELANILQSPNCNISRLELCGSFGDEGVEFLADALKTNRTVKTISIGHSEDLSDRGGRGIIQACKDRDGSGSWTSVIRSNHTLRSVFVSSKHAPRMSAAVLNQLQNLTTEDPHRTLRTRAWNFISNDMDCLPNLNLHMRHMPKFLAFVRAKGGQDSLFDVLRGGYFPDLFTSPTPEKVRLREQMNKIKLENETLRTSLEREMHRKSLLLLAENKKASKKSSRLLSQSTASTKRSSLLTVDESSDESTLSVTSKLKRDHEAEDVDRMKSMKKCCLVPFIKAFEAGQMMLELLREIYRI